LNYVYDVVANKFTFAISSPDEFLVSSGQSFSRQSSVQSQPTALTRLLSLPWKLQVVVNSI